MGFYEPNSNLLLLQVLRGLLAREETGAIPHKGSYSVLQGEKIIESFDRFNLEICTCKDGCERTPVMTGIRGNLPWWGLGDRSQVVLSERMFGGSGVRGSKLYVIPAAKHARIKQSAVLFVQRAPVLQNERSSPAVARAIVRFVGNPMFPRRYHVMLSQCAKFEWWCAVIVL